MVEHQERRQFWRAPFIATALLVEHAGATGAVHKGCVHDISLKGALFETEGEWHGQLGERFQLRLELSEEVSICMQVTAMYVKERCIGLRCDEIDIDSITALRRLIQLNSGGQQHLERELRALVKR